MAAYATDELHQALIRDHFRRPRNRGTLGEDAHQGCAHNRFCGDTVIIRLRLDDDGRIAEIGFDGRGCAISQAAASMLTVLAMGKTIEEVTFLRERFVEGLNAGAKSTDPLPGELGDLRALAGVRRFPSRIRCAVLPFDALQDAQR